jgi:phage/plasmid-like protein (TIGR03299 family)
MAHNLAEINGKVAMYMVGKREDAWHKLGQRVDGAVSWQEAMKLAGLDWQAIKVQNFAVNPSGANVPVDSYSIFRDIDNQLLASGVGEGFTIKQNSECFNFVDDLLEAQDGAHYDSAGALGNGAQIWVSARIPQADFAVLGESPVQNYLGFTTAHDGSMAHTAFISAVQTVCENTLRQALSTNTGMLRIKHTKNADQRFADAKRVMQGVVMDAGKLREKLELLATRKITRESMTSILDKLFPKNENAKVDTRRDNVLAEVLALYASNDNNAFPRLGGTAYNLLNAVTEWTDHLRNVRMTDSRIGMSVDQARAENAVIGTGEKLKSSALEVILESTNGAERVNMPKIISMPDSPQVGGLLGDVIAATA